MAKFDLKLKEEENEPSVVLRCSTTKQKRKATDSMLVDSSIAAGQTKQNNSPLEKLSTLTPIVNNSAQTQNSAQTLSFNATISTINSDLSSSLNRSISNKTILTEKKELEYKNLISKLKKEASENIFNKKEFTIDKKSVYKTAVYNFFDSQTVFDKKPENSIEFICIICHKVKKEKIGESTNLNSHLKDHNTTTDSRLAWWYSALEKHKKPSQSR